MENSYRRLWAKSVEKSDKSATEGELLLQHTLNVARNGAEICRNLPFAPDVREELAKILLKLGAFHDLGKAATGFQTMLRGGESWKRRHETLSTAVARLISPELEECDLLAILTHHRNIPDGLIQKKGEKCLDLLEFPFDVCGNLDDSKWRKKNRELLENYEAFRDLLSNLAEELQIDLQTIAEDVDLLDFGLDEEWFNREYWRCGVPKEKRWRASLLRGLLITADHTASAVEPDTGEHPKLLTVRSLKEYESDVIAQELGEYQILPFQEKAARTIGNAILKAPTGSGKTLAAMLWAQNNQVENGRFFYVLPFTASINAMTTRFRAIFGDENVGVLHHRNADYLFRMMETDEMSAKIKNKQAKYLASLAREMYHPIRICTPHQILRFALRGRGWETGLAEFHQACFVFDEVHAFEPLLAGLTLATVKLFTGEPFNAKVLFASVTIPKFLENYIRDEIGISADQIISPNPENEFDKIVCDKERHKLTVREDSLLENLNQIANEIIESGESALIVCNHVKTSQQVWEYFADKQFEDSTLLHSRFNGRDRNRIEEKITRKKSDEEKKYERELIKSGKRKPAVLIATQAVEVSLDIDYGRGYSEPAPADALGQRLGRINRSGSRKDENNASKPSPVIIFAKPSNGYLYDETLTNRTIELLREVDILTEGELTEIVDKVYENGYPLDAMENFKKGLNNEDVLKFAERIIAGTHRSWTDDLFDKNDGQVEVLPETMVDEIDGYNYLIQRGRYIEAHQLLVPIRFGQMFVGKKNGAIWYNEDLREHVTNWKYDEDLGLKTDSQSSNIL